MSFYSGPVVMKFLCLFAFAIIFVNCRTEDSQLKQERATINYCNPKFVSDCKAITRRLGRGEPYKTNLTVISRYLSDNNVTMRAVWFGTIAVELLKVKLCEIVHVDWLFDYLKVYSDINPTCPFEARQYGLYNLEFPPKNMPRRLKGLLKGHFHLKFYFQATKTEEVLVESTLIFRSIQ